MGIECRKTWSTCPLAPGSPRPWITLDRTHLKLADTAGQIPRYSAALDHDYPTLPHGIVQKCPQELSDPWHVAVLVYAPGREGLLMVQREGEMAWLHHALAFLVARQGKRGAAYPGRLAAAGHAHALAAGRRSSEWSWRWGCCLRASRPAWRVSRPR